MSSATTARYLEPGRPPSQDRSPWVTVGSPVPGFGRTRARCENRGGVDFVREEGLGVEGTREGAFPPRLGTVTPRVRALTIEPMVASGPYGATSQLPERIVLRPSRRRLLLLSALGVLMIAVSVFDAIVIGAEKGAVVGFVGWFGNVFFSVALLLIVVQVVQPDRFGVELDPSGFTVRGLFGSTRYRWDQVDEFATVRIGSQTLVGFNYHDVPEYRGRVRRSGVKKRRPLGFDSFLPATLERRGEPLMRFMDSWRERR